MDAIETILERIGDERRIHYGLDHVEAALAELGHPEKSVKTIVIAGTNGKGGTTLLISSGLVAAGYNVGTYLSPHLQSPTERMLFNLTPIGRAELNQIACDCEVLVDRYKLTYFEFLTIVMFVAARNKQVDYLVLEVGLGGRLDATNVTTPTACVITHIDLDHQKFLGDTREAILIEKMGILRPNVPVFSGLRRPHLRELLAKRCQELNAPCFFIEDAVIALDHLSWDGQGVWLSQNHFELSNPTHAAARNAAVALALLRHLFPNQPMQIWQDAFRGIRNPGRMEVVQSSPRVVLSGDHNPAGIECLINVIPLIKDGPLRILCGFSPDKPYQEMVQTLRRLSDDVTVTSTSRFYDGLPESYRSLITAYPPKKALESVLSRANRNETVLVTGSLYLVGEVRSLWKSDVQFFENSPKAPVSSIGAPGETPPATLPGAGA